MPIILFWNFFCNLSLIAKLLFHQSLENKAKLEALLLHAKNKLMVAITKLQWISIQLAIRWAGHKLNTISDLHHIRACDIKKYSTVSVFLYPLNHQDITAHWDKRRNRGIKFIARFKALWFKDVDSFRILLLPSTPQISMLRHFVQLLCSNLALECVLQFPQKILSPAKETSAFLHHFQGGF